MSQQTVGHEAGKSLLHNWVEERAVSALDTEETRTKIQRHWHRGIFTLDQDSKMATITTFQTAYIIPKSSGVRLRGIRSELLGKQIAQMISERIHAEEEQPHPKTKFCSTTQEDFRVEGFVPLTPESSQVRGHNYKTDQAITFWSENRLQIQGVSCKLTMKAPFRKSALFSTPITERVDEIDVPSDDYGCVSEHPTHHYITN